MRTPFPGMDPYLEHPGLWPDVHNALIARLRDDLAPRLRPRYFVALEQRTYLNEPEGLIFAGRPDAAVVWPRLRESQPQYRDDTVIEGIVTVELPVPDEVRETYLEVRSVGDDRVITVLEILSPANKRTGQGRQIYEHKRLVTFGTSTSLVEIDLLRAGEPMLMWGDGRGAHYRILVSRASRRPRGDLLPFTVRQAIPAFCLPLQRGDEEPQVELNPLLHDLYQHVGYDLRLNYRTEAEPPLAGEDAVWADALLREAGLR
jgi:hypothetical protein